MTTVPPPIEFHLPTVSSTNDYARELLDTYPYVFVSAVHQTAGRGRKGKEWVGDPAQNAYVSVGVRHTEDQQPSELAVWMGRGALAMLGTLRALAPGHKYRLKYPNDVQVQTAHGWAKIGGALVEHQFQGDHCLTTILGMGVNVNQVDFPDTIEQPCTSLLQLGSPLQLSEFIQELKRQVSEIRVQPTPHVHDEWVAELNIVGRTVQLEGSADDWVVVDILADGRLVSRNSLTQNERTITDGDTVRYDDRDQ